MLPFCQVFTRLGCQGLSTSKSCSGLQTADVDPFHGNILARTYVVTPEGELDPAAFRGLDYDPLISHAVAAKLGLADWLVTLTPVAGFLFAPVAWDQQFTMVGTVQYKRIQQPQPQPQPRPLYRTDLVACLAAKPDLT